MSFLSNIIIIIFIVTKISKEDCSNVGVPTKEGDCFEHDTEDNACCFVTIIKEDNPPENECWPIEKNLRYFLNYLTVFDYKEHKNIKANFSCNNTEEQSCGIDNPTKFYECSEHSSKLKSCCMLVTPTKTNCVMSQEKFDDGTNITIFDNNYIICDQLYLVAKMIYLAFILVLYII